MLFKKLELLGFKSFGEHTELVFEPGITAIVGPNGTGKSNLADGIKWVLGEQSARELRGGRMEDIIFNGSDRREPINYAEVSLTLDNSDNKLPIGYSEIVISRRLFRSGESEYLLNGTQVRLKEITELLMGTGIGTSAYSLFEQGRIEQIISARPEERRAVFEEAAGITKFKSQKREALRRLEETEANLLRVGDVIAEIKRQIQALERQVRRAKSYQEQFEKLKRLEVRVAEHESDRLTGQWKERQENLDQLRKKSADLENQLTGREERLEEARQAAAKTDEELSRAREALMAAENSRQATRHRLEMTQERIAEQKGRQARVEEERAAIDAQILRLKQQNEELDQSLSEAEEERGEKEEAVVQAVQRLEGCLLRIAESEKGIARAQEQLMEQTVLEVQMKNEAARLRQQATHLEVRVSRLGTEETKVASERSEAFNLSRNLEQALTQAKEGLETILQEQAGHQEEQARTEAALTQAQTVVAGLEQERTKLNFQWELLKGLLASHEGYSSGVKALLTALDQGIVSPEGINGVLAELIQVGPEESAAVDAALGSYAQALVVDSMEVARRCCEFLEQSRAGRVLFLIRDRVPSDSIRPEPAVHPSTLRLRSGQAPLRTNGRAVPLLDRIGVTPHLEPLVRLLLSDTWLVPDRETAQRLLSSPHPSPATLHPSLARFVTPEGELWNGTSALLGSSPSEEGLVVGRRSRLQSFEAALAGLEERLDQARKDLSAVQEKDQALVQSGLALEAVFKERSLELHRVEANHRSAAAALGKLDQEQDLLKTEKGQVEEEHQEIRAQLLKQEERLASKQQECAALQGVIASAQEEIAKAAKEREGASVALATAKAEIASFDQILASRRASLHLLGETLQAAETQIEECRQELIGLQETQRQAQETCVEMEASLGRLADEGSQAQAQVAAAESRRGQALETARHEEREFLGFSRQFEQLQTQLHQKEMEQAQISFQREQIFSRLSQVYGVELGEDGKEELPETVEAMRGRIDELSQKLQRMGPVNLGSIGEERELQTRYEFLSTQQADLIKAKEDLHSAITKINRTTRAMFRETFEAIQKEFQVTFKQLFGGGEARLLLLDEEDVLESGVEIIARPPGKPLQAISLLSGGEKTLTTIALLFAIFRVKPSPFCLLDEIDASLDETNVGRFTAALREFLKDSQFIIITHNKKTITTADILYGITMGESGVSKIVSVKFKQAAANGNGNGAHTLTDHGDTVDSAVRPEPVEG